MRAQLGQGLRRGVGPHALVPADRHRVAAPLRHLDRDHLVVEQARVPGGRGALVAAGGVGVRLVPGDAELRGEVLRGLDHPGDLAEPPFRLRPLPAPVDAVVQDLVPGPGAPADRGRVVLGVAHRLGPARQHHVGGAGLDHHRRGDDRLQPAAAAPVDLQPGHADRQAGVQRRPPPDAGRLAVDVGLGERHVVDDFRVDPGPLEHRLDRGGGEFLDRDGPQAPAERAHRGPHRRDDRCPAIGGWSSLVLRSVCGR